MLYYDATEAREGTHLPQDVIDYGKQLPELESITGADLLIIPELSQLDAVKQSELVLPLLAKEQGLTIPEIIKMKGAAQSDIILDYALRGGIFVQRKSGLDLLASVGERLNDCLARMVLTIPKQCQRVLLYTGSYTNRNGQLILDGKPTNYDYWSYQGALSSFVDRGGVSVNLSNDADMLHWIKVKEGKLREYQRQDTKWIYGSVYYPLDLPDSDDPLQLPVKVSDGRLVLAQFPGIGPDKVNALAQYIKQLTGYMPSTFELLHYATSWETAKNVVGWGKKSIQAVRDFMGLEEGYYLFANQGNITVQRE